MHRVQSALTALVLVFGLSAAFGPAARAQSTEERFQDLFITAGYCTAFGAAAGTALLFLVSPDAPTENLKYVAMGASLGFLGGSILGTYVIFSPMMAQADQPIGSTLLASQPLPERGFVVRPVWDAGKNSMVAVEGGMTLLNF